MNEITPTPQPKGPINCGVICVVGCVLDGAVTVLDFPAAVVGMANL